MYDRSRMHRSKNNHLDLGSMSWPTDNTPREAEAFHTPTANRFHLTWVGSGPRHDIAASLCSQPPTAYRQPLAA